MVLLLSVQLVVLAARPLGPEAGGGRLETEVGVRSLAHGVGLANQKYDFMIIEWELTLRTMQLLATG